jgi:beta-catenin-like protein 1
MLILIIQDIAASIINLLQELTDVDSINESVEGATQLIDALCDQQVISLLVSNLERFDETKKDEADGVYNALGKYQEIIIDHLLKINISY